MGNKSVVAEHRDALRQQRNDGTVIPSGKRFRMKEGLFMQTMQMGVKTPSSSSSANPASTGQVKEELQQTTSLADFQIESTSEEEEAVEPKEFTRKRKNAISGEAEGVYNPRRAGRKPQTYEKTPEQEQTLRIALKGCPFFKGLEEQTMSQLVSAMPIKEIKEGDQIIQQGELGDSAYVLLSGECYICDESGKAEIYNKDKEDAPSFKKVQRTLTKQLGNVSEDASRHRLGTMRAPRFFGEIAMLWGAMRTVSVYAAEPCVLAELPREDYTNLVVLTEIEIRNHRTEVLRKVKLLETLQDEQITKLADALDMETYEEGEVIIKQGETGKEFFVVESGECKATVSTGAVVADRHDAADERVDVQEHRRYGPGELFGEKALLSGTVRAASITATCRTQLLKLTRRKFERLLGSLNELGDAHYLTDPRKDIAEFYRQGDAFGPSGSKLHCGPALQAERANRKPALSGPTDWFCVYRPTSRDAISKLLSGNAVGKGLNVKGKSAKRGRLSGFVPFLQIHDNSHKKDIEESPEDSWIEVYYESEAARAKALEKLRAEAARQKIAQAGGLTPKSKATKHGHGHGNVARDCNKDPFEVTLLNSYTEVFGLDVPERVLREVYIIEPDLSFLAGWETGRNSEPAFMDMNLHAFRDGREPKVVLYQFDKDNPMNPQGLLIAYAEAKVKPVVSDFDTFLVGSRGVIYEELSLEQASIAAWALDNTLNILHNPGHLGWNSRWLEVIAKANEEGFHPETPTYGFGDPMSYRLVTEVVAATIESGAVRHGAECFNFFFPQELDEEYLVVWENFPDKPWTYLREEPLREFLLERVSEGFSFPLNPVWPVRDPGWYRVFEALQGKIEAAINLVKWMPQETRLMEKIQEIHRKFPEGFKKQEVHQPRMERGRSLTAKEAWHKTKIQIQTMKMISTLMDVQACEHADYLAYKMKKPKASLKGEEEIDKMKAAGKLGPLLEADQKP